MLFRSTISKSCSYCLYSSPSEEDRLHCTRCGAVQPDGKCFRFRYDPCKRVPPRPKAIDFDKYEDEDYTL